MTQLNSGIPEIKDYENLISSDLFLEMETFSNAFLTRNNRHLEDYSKKWISDSLHQWSRQWEYPFAYTKITSHRSTCADKALNILDAGSGITFFPYFLKLSFPHSSIYCCDYDASLKNTYQLINRGENQPISFSVAALENTKFQDAFFDCVCCISVLEHTANYQQIIDEFYRIMKPDGLLVITFDISLDGYRDISPASAQRLLMTLKNRFSVDDRQSKDVITLIRNPERILTTRYAAKLNPALIPWKNSPSFMRQVRSFIRRGKFMVFPPPLTVFCQSLTKTKGQPNE